MIFRLLRRRPSESTIAALYGAIVAQARAPGFYLDYGVPDTLEGRFDMIVLHLFLVRRRLERGGGDMAALGWALFDRFCRDLDHNLREMGVSDLAVPRKMRDFAGAYYGRAQAYEQVLADSDREGAAESLSRNVFAASGPPGPGPRRLADYMIETARRLDAGSDGSVTRGDVNFPDPHAIAGEMSALEQAIESNGAPSSAHR